MGVGHRRNLRQPLREPQPIPTATASGKNPVGVVAIRAGEAVADELRHVLSLEESMAFRRVFPSQITWPSLVAAGVARVWPPRSSI
jgi:hypothetical protein